MTKILMPINPKYVNLILSGAKRVEYRKIKPKRNNIDKMIIYSTSPVSKVVGEVEVLNILVDKPDEIWKLTQNYSGVSKTFYDDYYKNKEFAVAFMLGNVTIYDKAKNLKDIGINYIPQSFIYLD
jgi:predicted transcriptional regulator